ncbi:hypothetical protein [Niveispirillum irakense]|uniref:hypothetical protein n=1 Tax=Niveispirillum irakense TaxID=34011 RepID=UPI0003FFDBC6|nr:hypothetical protein [Niveispirillum irakense]
MPRLDQALSFPSLLHRLTNPERAIDAGITDHNGVEPAALLAAEITMVLTQPCFLPPDKAAGPASRHTAPFQALPLPITPGPYTAAGLEGLRRQVLSLLKGAEPRLTALTVTAYQHQDEGGLVIEGHVGIPPRPLALRLPLWPIAGPVRVEPMGEDRLS